MIEFLLKLVPMFSTYQVVIEVHDKTKEQAQPFFLQTLVLTNDVKFNCDCHKKIGDLTVFNWLGFKFGMDRKVEKILADYLALQGAAKAA